MPDLLFERAEELNKVFAREIVAHLRGAIATRGTANLVVSGGSTPAPLFELLTKTEIDWAKVTILLADERWVASDHPDSNEGLLKRTLLQGQASQAKFVSLISAFPDEERTLKEINAALKQIDCFDVVILGMGNDGHTASLFPCSAELKEGLTTSAAALMVQPATAPHQRISLSAQRLKKTHVGFVHTVGADKAATYEAAMANNDVYARPVLTFLPPQGNFSRRHATER
jgi:6-phosphogluconolactonase